MGCGVAGGCCVVLRATTCALEWCGVDVAGVGCGVVCCVLRASMGCLGGVGCGVVVLWRDGMAWHGMAWHTPDTQPLPPPPRPPRTYPPTSENMELATLTLDAEGGVVQSILKAERVNALIEKITGEEAVSGDV